SALLILPPPTSTLFPYTTLFRSQRKRIIRLAILAGRRWILASGHLGQRNRQRFAVPIMDLKRLIQKRFEIVEFQAHIMVLSTPRSEEHRSELQSRENLVCRLLLE